MGFKWNESSNTWSDGNYNYWSKLDGEETKRSTLNEKLNTTYLNTTLGGTWSNMIEEVQWNVGGVDDYKYTPGVMKEAEESMETEGQGGSITSTDKIGLMYLYDYGFASAKENWDKTLYCYSESDTTCYHGNTNRSNNWLFNGVIEWTISCYSFSIESAFYVDGIVGYYHVSLDSYGVRPVFYLKSNVQIIADDNTDGTYLKPFRVG